MSKEQEESKELDYPVAIITGNRNNDKDDFRYHYFPVGDKVFVIGKSDFSPPDAEMMKCIPYDEDSRSSEIFQNINVKHLEYI